MSTNLPQGHESVVSDRKNQFCAAMLTLQSLCRRFSFFKIDLLLDLTNVASLVSYLNQSAKTHELHIRQLVAKLDSADQDKRHAVTMLESTIERLKTELSVCQNANVSLVKQLGEGGRDADITPVKRLPFDIEKAMRLTNLMLQLGEMWGHSNNKRGSTSLHFKQDNKEEHASSNATLGEISALLASIAADVEAAKQAKDAF